MNLVIQLLLRWVLFTSTLIKAISMPRKILCESRATFPLTAVTNGFLNEDEILWGNTALSYLSKWTTPLSFWLPPPPSPVKLPQIGFQIIVWPNILSFKKAYLMKLSEFSIFSFIPTDFLLWIVPISRLWSRTTIWVYWKFTRNLCRRRVTGWFCL